MSPTNPAAVVAAAAAADTADTAAVAMNASRLPSSTNILSDDNLRLVFLYLSVPELGRCATLNRAWNQLLCGKNRGTDIMIWRSKIQEREWRILLPTEGTADTRHNAADDNKTCARVVAPVRELEDRVRVKETYYYDFYYAQLRQSVENELLWEQTLIQRAFAHSSQSRALLLCGHQKRVVSMMIFYEKHFVTFSEDGTIRTWDLPLRVSIKHQNGTRETGNRQYVGRILYDWKAAHQNNKIANTTSIIDHVSTVGSNGVAFSVGSSVIVMEVTEQSLQQSDSHHPQTSSLKARVIHEWDQIGSRIHSLDSSDTIVALGCSNGTIRLYPTNKSKHNNKTENDHTAVFMELTGHRSAVGSVDLMEDCRLLSTCSDQTIRLWKYDITRRSGQCLRVIRFDGAIGGPTIVGMTNTEFIAAGYTLDGVELFRYRFGGGTAAAAAAAADKEMILSIPVSSFHLTCFNLYGRFVLCGTNSGRLLEFDIDTGHQTRDFPNALLDSDSAIVRVLIFEMTRRTVLAADTNGQMALLNMEEGTILWSMKMLMSPSKFLFSSFNNNHASMFVSSSGYLVRAFVFKQADQNRQSSDHENIDKNHQVIITA